MDMAAIFDSNIIIDALNSHRPALDAIKSLGGGSTTMSRISWIEILAGAKPDHRAATEAYLRGCNIIELTPDIAARAVEIRRDSRLNLGDAIIWSTALISGRTLITRDSRDFPPDWPGVHRPYQI